MNLTAGRHHFRAYIKLRRKCDLLPNLGYATLVSIVQEALEVEDENGRERLDVDLLGRIEDGAWSSDGGDLYRLGRGDVCESIFDGVDRVALDEFSYFGKG
jgi:hypothetical protein